MARVTLDDSSLTAIADAIRGKLDVMTFYKPSEMASAIASIETGGADLTSADEGKVVVESGGEYVLQAQTSRSISNNGTYDTTTNNEVVVAVSGGASLGPKTITANGTYDPATDGLDGYDEVTVAVSGGGGVTGLLDGTVSQIADPDVTTLRAYALFGCSSLANAAFPACTSVGSYAFASCANLANVSLPACTNVNKSAFQNCESLLRADLPEVTYIDEDAFWRCYTLSEVNIPKVTVISSRAFASCSVREISLPACMSIGSSAFYNCQALSRMYLLGSSVVRLANYSPFYNTPISESTFTGAFGSVFVPSSLYEAYISATYWSRYSARIASYTGE